MKRVKVSSLVYQLVLGLFVSFSCYLFICGEFGIIKHYFVKKEVESKQRELLLLQNEIGEIQDDLHDWQHDPFYLEKMAREELGMGYRDEIVYVRKA